MFHIFKSPIVVAWLAWVFLAAPAMSGPTRCDVSSATIDMPSGAALPEPKYTPTFVGLGVGTQNYTCASTGTYTNVGALAELYDVSCLYRSGSSAFEDITEVTLAVWSTALSSVSPSEIISLGEKYNPPFVLGEHYFVTNPVSGTGLSPKWDFTSHAFSGNPEAFVFGSKIDDVPAPTGTADIDWLYLTNLTGTLANEIYRVDTRGGQPPHSCTPGSNEISVKYTALYWFTGGFSEETHDIHSC